METDCVGETSMGTDQEYRWKETKSTDGRHRLIGHFQ
jgi:hypothetical protein